MQGLPKIFLVLRTQGFGFRDFRCAVQRLSAIVFAALALSGLGVESARAYLSS